MYSTNPERGMMSAQSLASFCCSRKKRWCSWHASQPIARRTLAANRRRSRPAGRMRSRTASATSHQSVASMQPRYQKSASAWRRSTNFGICPFAAWWAASVARPVAAARSSAGAPESAMPIAHTAASRPKIAV